MLMRRDPVLLVRTGFHADLLVDGQVIWKSKLGDRRAGAQEANSLAYLKLADKRLGLLINFNVAPIKSKMASSESSTGSKNDLSQSRQGRKLNAPHLLLSCP